jgi:predicted CoA-binding protein
MKGGFFMNSKALIEDFVSQRTLALVGMSRDPKKFGNMIYKELTEKGYHLLPIHAQVKSIGGVTCYPSLAQLQETVGGVIIVVPPSQTEKVVREVAQIGIPRVWIQQGAESQDAIQFCQQNGIKVVYGECIMMFAEPIKSFHKFHRFIWKLIGKIPA